MPEINIPYEGDRISKLTGHLAEKEVAKTQKGIMQARTVEPLQSTSGMTIQKTTSQAPKMRPIPKEQSATTASVKSLYKNLTGDVNETFEQLDSQIKEAGAQNSNDVANELKIHQRRLSVTKQFLSLVEMKVKSQDYDDASLNMIQESLQDIETELTEKKGKIAALKESLPNTIAEKAATDSKTTEVATPILAPSVKVTPSPVKEKQQGQRSQLFKEMFTSQEKLSDDQKNFAGELVVHDKKVLAVLKKPLELKKQPGLVLDNPTVVGRVKQSSVDLVKGMQKSERQNLAKNPAVRKVLARKLPQGKTVEQLSDADLKKALQGNAAEFSKTEVWSALQTSHKLKLLKKNKVNIRKLHTEQYAHFKEFQGRVAKVGMNVTEYLAGVQEMIKAYPEHEQLIIKRTMLCMSGTSSEEEIMNKLGPEATNLPKLTKEDMSFGANYKEFLQVMKDAAEEQKKIEPVLIGHSEELKKIFGQTDLFSVAIQPMQRLAKWELLHRDFNKNCPVSDPVLKGSVEALFKMTQEATAASNEKVRAFEEAPNEKYLFSTKLFDEVLMGGTEKLRALADDIHRESQRCVGEFAPELITRYAFGTTKELKEKRAKLEISIHELEAKIEKEDSEGMKIEFEEDLDALQAKINQIDEDMPLAEKIDNYNAFANGLSVAFRKNILHQTDLFGNPSRSRIKEVIRTTIQLMKELYEEGDLNSVMLLSGALGSSEVDRILTREEMHSEIPEEIGRTLSPSGNFKAYHAFTEQRIDEGKPLVPFIGLYMSQITFARDGNNPEKAKEIADSTKEMCQRVEIPGPGAQTALQEELKTAGELREQQGPKELDKMFYDHSVKVVPRNP